MSCSQKELQPFAESAQFIEVGYGRNIHFKDGLLTPSVAFVRDIFGDMSFVQVQFWDRDSWTMAWRLARQMHRSDLVDVQIIYAGLDPFSGANAVAKHLN